MEQIIVDLYEDRLLVERIKEGGALETPDDADSSTLDHGVVVGISEDVKPGSVHVGPGTVRLDTYVRRTKVGDQVYFNHYEKKIEFAGKEFWIVREANVMLRYKDA